MTDKALPPMGSGPVSGFREDVSGGSREIETSEPGLLSLEGLPRIGHVSDPQ